MAIKAYKCVEKALRAAQRIANRTGRPVKVIVRNPYAAGFSHPLDAQLSLHRRGRALGKAAARAFSSSSLTGGQRFRDLTAAQIRAEKIADKIAAAGRRKRNPYAIEGTIKTKRGPRAFQQIALTKADARKIAAMLRSDPDIRRVRAHYSKAAGREFPRPRRNPWIIESDRDDDIRARLWKGINAIDLAHIKGRQVPIGKARALKGAISDLLIDSIEGPGTRVPNPPGRAPAIGAARARELLREHRSQDLIEKARLRRTMTPTEAKEIASYIGGGGRFFDVGAVLSAAAGQPTYYDARGYVHGGTRRNPWTRRDSLVGTEAWLHDGTPVTIDGIYVEKGGKGPHSPGRITLGKLRLASGEAITRQWDEVFLAPRATWPGVKRNPYTVGRDDHLGGPTFRGYLTLGAAAKAAKHYARQGSHASVGFSDYDAPPWYGKQAGDRHLLSFEPGGFLRGHALFPSKRQRRR